MVPSDNSEKTPLVANCAALFMQLCKPTLDFKKPRVRIVSCYDDICRDMAREIAIRLNISFLVTPLVSGIQTNIIRLIYEEEYPNNTILILVFSEGNATSVVRMVDDDCPIVLDRNLRTNDYNHHGKDRSQEISVERRG